MRRTHALAGPSTLSVRAPVRAPARAPVRSPAESRPQRQRVARPPAPKARRRQKRPSLLWRYRRLWFLFALLVFTGLAGVAWVVTHVPLPPEAPQAQTTIIYDGAGNQMALLHGDQNRFPVKLDSIPKVTQDAVVSAEDHNFFRHRGIDPMGILRATWADLRHKGARQGASTITQQYVKNAFTEGSSDRTMVRKLKEAAIAVKLEHKYTKREILERYLNAVYFGRGAYGVQAAAKAYFGLDAAQLGLKESAYLAGLIRTPSTGDATTDPDQAKQLRTFVLEAMVRDKAITRADAERVEGVPLSAYVIKPIQPGTTVISKSKGVDYFVEYVRRELLKRYTTAQVLRGGMRVYTTLDPALQDMAFDTVYRDTLNRASDPSAALVSVDTEGRVVAMVGGRDWNASKVNLAVGTDGGGSGRQGGSAFKPFTLAESIHEGYSVKSNFRGPAEIVLPRANGGEDWDVKNFEDASYGQVNLVEATVNSVNTVYAQLVTTIGADKVADMARKLGIKSELPALPSIALGTPSVSVMEMAGAYLTFAKEGLQVDPRVIKRITVGASVLQDDRAKPTRVLTRNEANTVNFVLRQVVERGSGSKAKLPMGPAWGKTGTTDNYGDAWFVGYNHKLTTAIWMGYPAGQSKPLLNVHGVAKVNGGSLPAEMWRRFMIRAAPNDLAEFPIPAGLGGMTLSTRVPFVDKGPAGTTVSGGGSGTTVPKRTSPSSTAPSATVPKSPRPTAPGNTVVLPSIPNIDTTPPVTKRKRP